MAAAVVGAMTAASAVVVAAIAAAAAALAQVLTVATAALVQVFVVVFFSQMLTASHNPNWVPESAASALV